MEPGDIVELEPEGIAHGGAAVARHEGRVVFVADAIPGERVRARLFETRKAAFWRAEAVEVLAPSRHRRPHIWPEAAIERDPADRPGGADYGHIAPGHQRALKARVLAEALERHARGVALPGPIAVQPAPGETEDGTGWRTRVTLHVDAEGRAGPYAARSHRVIPVETLPLVHPALAAFVDPRTDTRIHTDFDSDAARSTDRRWELLRDGDGGLQNIIDGRGAERVITEYVGDRSFRLAAGGFWQVHREAPAVLSAAVARLLAPLEPDPAAHHLDLYGGVGLLGAALLDAAGPLRLTSVEADRTASAFAAENLARPIAGGRTAPVAAVAAGVAGFLRRTLAAAAAVDRTAFARGIAVLDPPRSGAGAEVVGALLELSPSAVLYVACDPVALARDLGLFAAGGYRPAALEAHDLFPNTHHLETIALLQR